MSKSLRDLFGLKYNPFLEDVPVEALHPVPRVADFCWRVEHGLAPDGGFGMISGDPGVGKSVALRLLARHLGDLRDVVVGVVQHPQSNIADFYRELGDLFNVPLKPHNRWAGFRDLRARFVAHIESTTMRPVLLCDEAQEMNPVVLGELRLLASTRFDSRSILGVVLCGDGRLPEMLRRDDLVPLGSRIRTRMIVEAHTPGELAECLTHRLRAAGNPGLVTPSLVQTLCEHALGNPRVLLNTASELLAAAAQRERAQLDDKLYLEVCQAAAPAAAQTPRRAAGRR